MIIIREQGHSSLGRHLVGHSKVIGNSGESAAVFVLQPEKQPWAPFRTLEDFEVTELAITSLLPRTGIAKLLDGVTGKWSNRKSPVTLKTYSNMDAVLYKARKYIVQVYSGLQYSIYPSDFIVSSSMKLSLRYSMENPMPFHFNIEIPGTTFPVLSVMNPSCRSTCGTLSRSIIVRVVSKIEFSTNQTLQSYSLPLLVSPLTALC